jgi:cell division protein FtsA
MGKKNSIVVGLDIGTSKICAAVGEMTERGLEIIGIGLHPSQGLRKGVVINIETTVNSLKKAVEEASLMAGCEIHTVFASISGGHIKAFNSHGIVAVKNKEVMARDLERVIDAAKAVAIPMDREVLHVLPQDYIIDDQDGIRDPLGMSGVRLEAKVHIVTGAVASAQNVIKCCNRAGLNVAEIVLAPLAAADAVLTDEERELGVVLVDVGGGTTDIAVYHDGTVKHTAVVPIGGNHITNDIAAGLRTAFNDAERLKNATAAPARRWFLALRESKCRVLPVKEPAPSRDRFSVRLWSRAWRKSSSWCKRKSPSRDTKDHWHRESSLRGVRCFWPARSIWPTAPLVCRFVWVRQLASAG